MQWELRLNAKLHRFQEWVRYGLNSRVQDTAGECVRKIRRWAIPTGTTVEIVEAKCRCAKSLKIGQRLKIARPVDGWFDFVLRDDAGEEHYICPANFKIVEKPKGKVVMYPDGIWKDG